MTNHDRLFKELLLIFFAEFLELFFPQMAAALDRESVTFLDKELFTTVPDAERQEPDLVARARFRGQDSFCLLHTESQAQPQENFHRRMFWYFALLDHQFNLPVYPIALFSHTSPKPETDRYDVAFPDGDVLKFRFRAVQLSKLNWRDFLRHENPVACALMAKMGMAPEERPRVKLECLRLLVTLRLDPARTRLISTFIDTYLRLNAQETLLFQQQADTVLPANEKEKVMELTTSWKEEGLAEGLAEGREQGCRQGRLEECQRMVLRQLRKRLQHLPSPLSARVNTLALEQLEDLGEALLDFHSLEDLESWLARNG